MKNFRASVTPSIPAPSPLIRNGYLASALLALLSTTANATVMGTGEIELLIQGTGGTPSARYGYADGKYGSARDTSMDPVISYATLDAATLQDQTTYGGVSLSGSFDAATGASAFSYAATSPGSDGTAYATASIDLYAYVSYTGLLTDFAYNYAFSGAKDDPQNWMRFMVQMEIYYLDRELGQVKVYSDYGGTNFASDVVMTDVFRTNWVSEYDNSNPTLSVSGTRGFGDYSRYGEQRWTFRYDLQSSAQDRFGPSATTVPEPGAFVLLGLGLTGLGFARRKLT